MAYVSIDKPVRRRDPRWRYVLLGVFAIVGVFSCLAYKVQEKDVEAANLAAFDPGYIISDWQMGNYSAMSEAEIQSWLSEKNSCDNRDYDYYVRLSANTKYTWHWENGHFVCLSEEKFGDNDNEIGFQYGETAAHIIWQAAQDYRINPQVLLVLLQKETGLITDRIPNNGDYRKATGYGCPDTAECSLKYYGFKNQIRNAAYLFRYVLDNGSRYYPVGENYVQYNPNAGCGGTMVNIRNRATASLYQYTPYQPNAAALAAGYGTGDSCSAYGNRNFYSYFEDWFGGIVLGGETYDIDADVVGDVIKSAFKARYGEVYDRLGEPTAKMNCNIGYDNACVKSFQNGVIIYSPATGAWESYGEIRKKHVELGTVDGILGFPNGPMNCNIGHDGACVQSFQNGVIIYSPATGAWESYGEIRKKHVELGTVDGILGFPISAVSIDLERGVMRQSFQNGNLIFSLLLGKFY